MREKCSTHSQTSRHKKTAHLWGIGRKFEYITTSLAPSTLPRELPLQQGLRFEKLNG